MKTTIVILAVCLCATLVNSLPIAKEGFQSKALDRLMVVEADNESALRSKRTIGLLRQLFPEVSKMIDDKVNMVVGEVFKIFGPVIVQGILGGNRNAGNKTESGTTVNVKNPFDEEDDKTGNDFKSFVDDDDFFSKPKNNEISTKIAFSLPKLNNEEDSKTTTNVSETAINATRIQISTTTTFIDEVSTTTSGENVTEFPVKG